MRTTLSAGHLAVALLSLSPVVSASWAWPRWLPHLDTLVVRNDTSSTSSSELPSQTQGSSSSTPTGGKSVIQTNLNTGGISQTGSPSGNKTTSGTKSKHTEFNPQDPAGSVVMVTPAPTDGTQLYKINDFVTWGWNYTNLQGTPTAVDVLVSCSAASETFTLTQNMSFAEPGSYTWDTGAYQTANIDTPLPIAEYTLLIYEAGSSISATAEAGYLAPFSGFTFGLYTGQPYTSLGDWRCATCSGAMSDMERRAVGVAVAMSVVTVLSFTWFVAGFGAFV